FFFSSRRRHTRWPRDWSSDVCSSDLVDGQVWDLARALPDGMQVAILTDKDPQALDVLRHSSAHVLATAVRQLFPHAKIGFGPPRSEERREGKRVDPGGGRRIKIET